MPSTHDHERARLMADWLATGGAGPETAAETPSGDDGLQAGPTAPFRLFCMADDGLKAMPTRWACQQGLKTPGLRAGGPL